MRNQSLHPLQSRMLQVSCRHPCNKCRPLDNRFLDWNNGPRPHRSLDDRFPPRRLPRLCKNRCHTAVLADRKGPPPSIGVLAFDA